MVVSCCLCVKQTQAARTLRCQQPRPGSHLDPEGGHSRSFLKSFAEAMMVHLKESVHIASSALDDLCTTIGSLDGVRTTGCSIKRSKIASNLDLPSPPAKGSISEIFLCHIRGDLASDMISILEKCGAKFKEPAQRMEHGSSPSTS